jgi:hypothetical protein
MHLPSIERETAAVIPYFFNQCISSFGHIESQLITTGYYINIKIETD